ncbi:molecular chaperone MKKS-like [Palaemon carinicauda]|uniref:molecular chaperone MKKS-like n=1 Tax=Palaemon carinicauda TaxID=392227 RepID=UPI0035B69214
MSGRILQEERVNGVYCHSLLNLSFTSMLAQYRKLLMSAYGPKAGTLLITNAVGRSTLASSSVDITKQLSFAHPCAKYINALISAQNTSCGLSGLYTGILCVRLLEEALCCEGNTPHYVIADVCEWIIDQLLTQMAQFPDQVVIDMDIGDIQQVSSFVKTILSSKASLNLTKAEMDNFSIQIVRAFLKSIPEEGFTTKFGHVNVLQGPPGSDARVFEGLLYSLPEFDTNFSKKITQLPKVINVLLFAVPLSPDVGKDINLLWTGSYSKEESFIINLVFYLLSILRDKDVHVLANQKYIHPAIKFELERKGCIVLERLGTVATDSLMKLSGCQAVTNLSDLKQETSSAVLGKLSSIQHLGLRGKNYILLKQDSSYLSTLLLPEVSHSIEGTLKEMTESCLAALKMVVVDGKVVAGGGCLETWLATQVTHLVKVNKDFLASMIEVPNHHIIRVGNAFVRVFMELAIQVAGGSSTTKFDWCIDSVFHHLWYSQECLAKEESSRENFPQEKLHKCVCGLLTNDTIKSKYGGYWYDLDFQMNQNVLEGSSEASCFCESMMCLGNNEGETFQRNSKLQVGDPDFGIDDDSLDEKVAVEDDVDSLEKTLNSLEEEGDSLEGRIESLDDDVDSLEDVLDKMVDQVHTKHNPKIMFNLKIPDILYDSYLAKYNAMRLALEGFTQLFQVGHCVYD